MLLTGYFDTDWVGDSDDRHSMTGNLFLMSGGVVSWLSKKQAVIALSTVEVEYIALSAAAQEAVWLKKLMSDLKQTLMEPLVLHEDNQGAIAIAKNPIAHARTKHINIHYHFIREAVQDGIVDLRYCPTEDMLADLLTKPLLNGRFESLTKGISLMMLPQSHKAVHSVQRNS